MKHAAASLAVLALCAGVAAAQVVPPIPGDEAVETIEVQGSRAELRKRIETFVSSAMRRENELVGRWNDALCPVVAGVAEAQATFIRDRLLSVEAEARNRPKTTPDHCLANTFIIVTDDPDALLAEWQARDPGMFRWRPRRGVTVSSGTRFARTWHNAIEVKTASLGSRLESPASKYIENVVVLVDSRETRGMPIAQLADYVALVSLTQLDATVDLAGSQSILELNSRPAGEAPSALTEWDHALLNALYRTSYNPAHQRMDITARMVRALAPRTPPPATAAPAMAQSMEPLVAPGAGGALAGALDASTAPPPPVQAGVPTVTAAPAGAPDDAGLETVRVEGSRAELAKRVTSFVSTLTRLDGDLVSRWGEASICPLVIADDKAEAAWIRQRLVEIAQGVPIRIDSGGKCQPNLTVIMTADLEIWKKRNPSLFKSKARDGAKVSHGDPVRVWHNAQVAQADGGPMIEELGSAPILRMKDSRIVTTAVESLRSVVVLADTRAAAGVTLQQLADYIAMVGFSRPDLKADLGQAATILRLFTAESAQRERGLTDWDLAFLRGLYRQSYSAVQQRSAIASRMVRELAPRAED
jgi:hypothetical protein